MTFGQQFGAYRTQVSRLKEKLTEVNEEALCLPLGATAIGTGLSTHEGYLPAVYHWLETLTGEKYRPETDFFDGLQHGDFYIEFSAQLKKSPRFSPKWRPIFRIQVQDRVQALMKLSFRPCNRAHPSCPAKLTRSCPN